MKSLIYVYFYCLILLFLNPSCLNSKKGGSGILDSNQDRLDLQSDTQSVLEVQSEEEIKTELMKEIESLDSKKNTVSQQIDDLKKKGNSSNEEQSNALKKTLIEVRMIADSIKISMIKLKEKENIDDRTKETVKKAKAISLALGGIVFQGMSSLNTIHGVGDEMKKTTAELTRIQQTWEEVK